MKKKDSGSGTVKIKYKNAYHFSLRQINFRMLQATAQCTDLQNPRKVRVSNKHILQLIIMALI
jgi:hypothetical protein